jgi:hypothetical protein
VLRVVEMEISGQQRLLPLGLQTRVAEVVEVVEPLLLQVEQVAPAS